MNVTDEHMPWFQAPPKPTEPARTFMGKRLVLCSYLEQDVVYMHPDSLFQLTGCRPEGITQAGVTVPPKENHPA